MWGIVGVVMAMVGRGRGEGVGGLEREEQERVVEEEGVEEGEGVVVGEVVWVEEGWERVEVAGEV